MQELHDDRYYVYCNGLFKIYKIADLEVGHLRVGRITRPDSSAEEPRR